MVTVMKRLTIKEVWAPVRSGLESMKSWKQAWLGNFPGTLMVLIKIGIGSGEGKLWGVLKAVPMF